ncbi:uncharacterized protein DFL_002298 [Arthrobotrys flagrans]|uniref:Mid2 domain-containing protein n=1 Tax=Arthrobotrys flagrans TaxID=97331 RepID=A0A437AAF1_ARTFL|nr:hypothetical protein DFL_002298 [Arthrobotrys flagrans]
MKAVIIFTASLSLANATLLPRQLDSIPECALSCVLAFHPSGTEATTEAPTTSAEETSAAATTEAPATTGTGSTPVDEPSQPEKTSPGLTQAGAETGSGGGSGGLSKGATIGIAVGASVGGLALIAAVVFLFLSRKKAPVGGKQPIGGIEGGKQPIGGIEG